MARVSQWLESGPAYKRVAVSIPSPSWGMWKRQPISLSPPLPLFQSIEKSMKISIVRCGLTTTKGYMLHSKNTSSSVLLT